MKLLRLLDDLIAPRGLKCLCCEQNSEGKVLCPTCTKALQAMRLEPDANRADNFRSALRYDGVAKELVVMLKLELQADAAEPLADEMLEAIKTMHLPADTVLTWVSMPEIRRRKRGIDHARKLCEALGQRTGRPVRQLLTRTGRVHTQRGLNRERRLHNLQGSLVCNERLSGPILLIDDVMTTGATGSACAQVLREAGASQVFVLTATKAMKYNMK